ncbi:uncharacterized protein LOC115633515 [Scaptodrosophila lebanonensis]|uniref:MICOS complex subunit MIC13 n=1 Tax=Drosophila lebanonensis TaxID=7225 RepID=A0A6J2UEP3_DROLE|nr:uncharacterized protein LOC115633515 [Scaptodrosophila lebanonensis]
MIVLVIKLALVAGTFYITKEMGVWSNPDRTSMLYEDAKCQLKPYTDNLMRRYCCWDCEPCIEKEPKPWRESWVDAWNDTIRKCFDALERTPHYCQRFTDDVQRTIDNLIHGDTKE